MRASRAVIAVFLASLAACAPELPLVERHETGDWNPTSFRLVSSGGQYAAPNAQFVLRFEDDRGGRLTVEGTVEIDPRARLVAGNWTGTDGAVSFSGTVLAGAVDYFGGQGGRPSLAGEFTLSSGEAALFRINLPRTTLTAER